MKIPTMIAANPTGWPDINNAGLPPEGTKVWVNVAQKCTEGVERPVYGNPDKTEKINTWRALFARVDDNGQTIYAQTREFKQSGFPKSGMMQFLTSWLGGTVPSDGSFDTDDLIGQGATLTISHKETRRGTTYAAIVGVSPVIEDLKDKIPDHTKIPVPGGDSDGSDESVPY